MSQRIRIFASTRSDGWLPMIRALQDKHLDVHAFPATAKYSIVLSGRNENPIALSGKKILVFHRDEWMPDLFGWRLFKPILDEYYDEFLDVTGLDFGTAVKKVVDYIAELNGKAD